MNYPRLLARYVRDAVHTSASARRMPLGMRQPIASFCFDDFPRSAYTEGGKILKMLGGRGTYYAAMGLANTTNDLGEQFRVEDLDRLMADGHELGSHTYNHVSCRKLSLSKFEDEVKRGEEAIRRVSGKDEHSFAYPYGHVTVRAKARIGAQMQSCRGILRGSNDAYVDLNLLRANSIYGDREQLPELLSILKVMRKTSGWVIFYTHDVTISPSPFGCTPGLLEGVLSAALDLGLEIIPVGEVVKLVQGECIQ